MKIGPRVECTTKVPREVDNILAAGWAVRRYRPEVVGGGAGGIPDAAWPRRSPLRSGQGARQAVVNYLDAGDLLVLATAVTGGDLVVRDLGLLDSAAHRPRATVLGVEAYDTLWLKASALLDSIVRTRPLAEGNWRLGWVAAVTLCDINGWWVDAEEDEALDLVRALGREQIDVAGMAAHLEAWGTPKDD
ncbi:type II toxin-antitoxin system death-on-curing family toxin [Actinosynnema sp. CS-041913]|uniref:type II toxin-antitoxin system death-on-curing family toxin n=1 Tax=Actinosynnema sp. CS-041913 TaxID=3239917 RepID=UPI003D8EE6B9